jgi:hypothetical protein
LLKGYNVVMPLGGFISRGEKMKQLIEAALEHARQLRQGANAADDRGARTTIEEAERWEVLASAARDELVRLVPSHRD